LTAQLIQTSRKWFLDKQVCSLGGMSLHLEAASRP
jgi:hypothetical protein